MDIKRNMERFLRDYYHRVSGGDGKLIRADIFTDSANNHHVAFLAEKKGKQVLLDGRCRELYTADAITPLFVRNQDPPLEALAPVYRIRHKEKVGLISPDGNYLIEPEYTEIRGLAIFRGDRHGADHHETAWGRAALFVCTDKNRGVDVYSTWGEPVFCDLHSFYPYQKKITAPASGGTLPRFEETICFCAVSEGSGGHLQRTVYPTEALFKEPTLEEERMAPLIRQPPWNHEKLSRLCKKEASFLAFLRPMKPSSCGSRKPFRKIRKPNRHIAKRTPLL